MKKIVIVLLVLALLFVSCAETRVFYSSERNLGLPTKAVMAEPYGIFSPKKKLDGIRYKASVGNVIWSVLLLETVVIPVVLCGWYLWEPKEMVDFDKAAKDESK